MESTGISSFFLPIALTIKGRVWVRGDILEDLTEGEMFPYLLSYLCLLCFTISKPIIKSLCLSAVKEIQWYSLS